MRITFVVPGDNFSGGFRVIALYGERLLDRGHDVRVVGQPPRPPNHWGRVKSSLRRGNLQQVRQELEQALVCSPAKVDGFISRSRCPLHIIDDYREIESRDCPQADVIVATWWETAEWVAAMDPDRGAKTYFMQDYGAPSQELEKVVPTWKLPLKMITISKWMEDLVLQHAPGCDVTLVENSVDLHMFDQPPHPQPEVPTIGFVYREAEVKGYDTVVEAYRLAKQRVPNLKLRTFGSLPREAHAHLPPDAEYHHRPPDDALAGLYGSCTAWLFASRMEGYGLPILEALACRTPLIATHAGAAPEWVERSGGWLVPVGDAQAMADAIVEVAGLGPDAWQQKSEQARACVERYTWDDATDRFEQVLRQACEARG